MRQCGQCTLCCRLVPVGELDKPANKRCAHQRAFKGCAIYASRPLTCRLWSCVWLGDSASGLSRPDLTHYVVDPVPDFVTAREDDGTTHKFGVVQVWCDPRHPDAWKDPALMAYIDRRGADEGFSALIRYDSSRGFVVFPPSVTGKGWVINTETVVGGPEHSAADVAEALTEATGNAYAVVRS